MYRLRLSILFIGLWCLSSTNSFAQLDGSISSGLGYNYNLFRAPGFYIDPNEEEIEAEDLIRQGAFAYTKTALTYELGTKQNKITLKAGGLTHQYPSDNSLQKWYYNASGTYRRRFKKKHYLYLHTYVKKNSQQGTNFSEDLFNIPFSYTKIGGYAELRLKLNKQYRFYSKLELLSKKYFDDSPLSFGYQGINSSLMLKRLFEKTNAVHNRLELEVGTSQRAYEKIKVLEEELELDTAQFWNRSIYYIEARAYIGLGEQVYYSPRLGILRQEETRTNGIFYHAFTFGNLFKYTGKKWTLTLSPELELRKYFPRTAEETKQNTRLYTYLKGNLSLVYFINDQWSFVVNGRFKNRISNVDEATNLYFRSYQTFSTSLGIRCQF